ncbi:MAG: hypothetical protein ABH852_00210 [Methanobacteriota archaeon]
MKASFLARSSSKPTPYHVVIEFDGAAVAVHCDCEAGARAQYCKHKAAVILGHPSMLFDSSQSPELARTSSMLRTTPLFSIVSQIAELEALLEKTKGQITSLKKAAARSMKEAR